jgi:hypothetical protein
MQFSKSVALYVGCNLALLLDNGSQGIGIAQILFHLRNPILHTLDSISFRKSTRRIIDKRRHWENLQKTVSKA